MKNILIASAVGALIFFVYQALSWMVLPFHADSMKYSAGQQEILDVLDKNLPTAGVYSLPNSPPGTSNEDIQKHWDTNVGKPWAIISYHHNYSNAMGMQMATSFILNFIACFLVSWLLVKGAGSFDSFQSRFVVSEMFFLFALVSQVLMQWNWWKTPGHYLIGEIIDVVISGLLLSSWLGWYLGRSSSK